MTVGSWLPSPVRAGASSSSPRVTASDPGAWLDGEPWVFELDFTNPDGTPTDLTGSRLYVALAAGNSSDLQPIQTCDTAANDGSLIIVDAVGGKATFSALPEDRTWRASYFGPALLLLPTIVYGDVYRQIGNADPVALTRVTLRVLPSTGAPVGNGPPVTPPGASTALDFSDPANSGLLAAICAGQATTSPPSHGGSLDFSDPANSGLLTAICAGQAAAPSAGATSLNFSDPANSGFVAAIGD